MPITIPPWVLAPEFSTRGSTVGPSGSGAILVRADSSRVTLILSATSGTITIAPSQQELSLGAIQWQSGVSPLIMTFDIYGGIVCGEWWFTNVGLVQVREILWRPRKSKVT